MNHAEREISQAIFGRDDYAPKVHFYDHPVPDAEATERSGRPRYKPAIYVVIKPTHPDLAVKDYRSRAITEADKHEYPQQWQKYLDTKDRLARRIPSIEAIPGMSVSAHAELKALELFNCEQLAAHEGDIAPYNYLKSFAKRIMELSDEFKDIPEEREPVRVGADRRQQRQIAPDWAGSRGSTQAYQEKGNQKEGSQEENYQKGSFSYSFTV